MVDTKTAAVRLVVCFSKPCVATQASHLQPFSRTNSYLFGVLGLWSFSTQDESVAWLTVSLDYVSPHSDKMDVPFNSFVLFFLVRFFFLLKCFACEPSTVTVIVSY